MKWKSIGLSVSRMFDQWTIAVFDVMCGYCPAIFRGYRVSYIGAYVETPVAGNDNVPRPKRV
jgi:hypothetical protein